MAKSINNNSKLENGKRKAEIKKNSPLKNIEIKIIVLRDKQFIERNSVLTDLFEVKHIKNLYCCCIAALMALLINYAAYDLIHNGELRLGHSLIVKSFSKLNYILFGWIIISVINLIIYFAFNLWAKLYLHLLSNWKIINHLSICCLIYYYFKSLQFAANFVFDYDLSIIGSVIILCEQIRLIMKIHAFIRSNAPKVLNYKPHSDKKLKLPTLSKYIHFLFIPTLIYRDEYPRTKRIRWRYVCTCFLEMFCSIIYLSYIFENYYSPVCSQFKTSKYNMLEIGWSILKNTIPSGAIIILGFYLFLHAWMNAFAEMTRFGDRLFYKDWWNSTTFGIFYKRWNIVVHDWLYTYIYKDMYEIITPGNTILSKVMVFFISSIFHEYIISYSMRIFFPVLFILFFGFGAIFAFIKNPDNSLFSILFLYSYSLGFSISLSSYVIEYCVRENDCILSSNKNFSLLESRSLSKYCFKS